MSICDASKACTRKKSNEKFHYNLYALNIVTKENLHTDGSLFKSN